VTQERLERAIASIMAIGVALSAALIALGFLASFAVGWDGSLTGAAVAHTGTTDFSGLGPRLAEVRPLAVVQLGLLVLVATPVVRVAATALGFAFEGDRLYVALCLIVLALLLGSLFLIH
jgi:uncharacterized membrane protein